MGRRGIEGIYPLSPGQRGILFHTLEAPDDPVYVGQTTCLLEGDLDLEAFRRAWTHVIGRHGILRSAFVWENVDEPVQVVREAAELPLQVLDLRGLDDGERDARWRRYVEHDRRSPFELRRAPLLRLALGRIDDRIFRLAWSNHHLILDGWSKARVLLEVLQSYEALRRNGQPRAVATRSFADYLGWLGRRDASRAETFWRQWLGTFTEPSRLTEPLESPSQTEGIRTLRRRLAPEPTQRLRETARRLKVTLSSLVHVAWGLTLSRETGRRDVVFGSVVSGRPEEISGIETSVGMFINTLPVRLRLRGEADTATRVRAFHEEFSRVLEFQETPLVQAAAWSGVGRGGRLFDHALAFESYPMDEALNGQGSLKISEVSNAFRSNYPLMVTVEPGARLAFRMDFDPDRLPPWRAVRLTNRFAEMLERMSGELLGGPRSIRQIGRLLDAERQQVVREWNDTRFGDASAALSPLTLAAWLDVQAIHTPDAVALVFEGDHLSYGTLHRWAASVAKRLRRRAVGPETRVGVCIDRSLELLVALLAVGKAGAAYVPLDASYPASRLEYMADDAELTLVLRMGSEVFLDGPGRRQVSAETAPVASASSSHLAYVIYTSGSTGRPKGAMNAHEGIVNRLRWMQRVYRLEPGDRVLQKTPVSFDVSVWELFWPLVTGATMVLARPEGHKDNAYLVELIEREEVTTLHFVPSMLGAFLEEPGLEDLTSLRWVIASGEALTPDHVRRFHRRLSGAALHNLYGPTEAAVDVTQQPMEGFRGGTVSIGRPIDNVTLHVLTPDAEPVPAGVPGELHIGGVAVGRGYLGRPALTAERFVPEPTVLIGRPPGGGRLYRTGDLARWRTDGALEYLGRLDHQVKIRGFRIELGEIETVLTNHPGVVEAVVTAREDVPGDARLAAYYVDSEEVDGASLRSDLEQRLPQHMVPAFFVRLDALPLSPNGKVDRRALPAPEAVGGGDGRAPGTPGEELLAGIWTDVLGIEEIGAEDDFFDLGGHSLLATRVVSQIREIFGVRLPVSVLFEAPTVEALAERIRTQEDARPRPPLVPVDRDRAIPLSFAQQRLWFLDRLVPDNPFYNVYAPLRLTGELRAATLQQAFCEVVRRHDALRTVFPEIDGDPVQEILPFLAPPLRRVDLSQVSSDRREAELTRFSAREARRPFRLSEGPLLRTELVRLTPGNHALLLNVSHVVFDGWSTSVLHREVTELYSTFSRGRPSPWDDPEIQYPDFAVWQRTWLSDETLERELEFWRTYLEGAPASLDLPLDRPRPAMETFRGKALEWRLPASVTAGLEALGRRQGATSFMTLLAIWTLVLRRYTGQTDVLVGSPIANRTSRELEELVGFFVNTLVLRSNAPGDPSFVDLLAETRRSCLAAYAHQDLPFERLVEAVDPERDLARNPLCHVLLALQNYEFHERRVGDLTFETLGQEARETGTSKFDLTLYAWNEGDELHGLLEYNLDIFDRTTVLRLLGHLLRAFRRVVESPDRRLSRIELMSSAQRAQLLREWNDTEVDLPEVSTLTELFERQVRAHPDAVAVVLGTDQLTWRELDRRAEGLAAWLQDRGVGLEGRVGLAVDRSLELVPALLAVLKAGATYVPLDRAYPSERLRFMIDDATVGVVLMDRPLPPEAVPPSVEQVSIGELLRSTDGSRRLRTVGAGPEALAYVIYTSGSTGTPKGVAVSHRAVIRLVWRTNFAALSSEEVFLALAPISFDASTLELWAPLVRGGRLVMAPAGRSAVMEIAEILGEQRVTVLWLTAGLFHVFVDEHVEGLEPVRQLLAGGDVLSPRHVAAVLRRQPGLRLINGYGPTENTTFTSCHGMTRAEDVSGAVPIGRPITGTRSFVVDRSFRLTPPGVSGELVTSGDGLARGYLANPAFTAERFVPHPFGGSFGQRLYRTGDLVRHLPDGRLDFLGRLDHQVKIRGFRIEPGEIESVLGEHPAVDESVVLAVPSPDGDRRLVAYVVPSSSFREPEGADADETPTGESREEQVTQWEGVFDELYRRNAADPDPTFNIVGWESHYTEAPIPADEMREWLDDTLERIASSSPRRVLEIGCGTGMLLFRIAPRCERYVGTDISHEALDFVRRHLRDRGEWASRVELRAGAGDDLEGWPDESFDTVILNSVVQYFPDGAYLENVLERTARLVRPGGTVFVGDVRSLPLLEAYHVEVQLHRASPSDSWADLRRRIQREILRENELVVAPGFFHGLVARSSRFGAVGIHPKRGRARNELTQFRYQVVLRVGTVSAPVIEPVDPSEWVDGRREGLTLERLRRRLVQERPRRLAVFHLPNARVTRAVTAHRLAFGAARDVRDDTVASFLDTVEAQRPVGVEPEALWDLGDELGYRVDVGWEQPGADGDLEALFVRDGEPAALLAASTPPTSGPPGGSAGEPADLSRYVNDPSRARFAARIVPRLRRHLEERLPSYMAPSAFVVLDALPLTANGKVDRRALPDPDAGIAAQSGPGDAPRTPVQARLVEIWRDILGIEDVGVNQDFFELGGHSLLATRVASRIRTTFGVELPLQVLFEATTIEELAERLEPHADDATPLVPTPRYGPVPASFAQERLWLIDRLEGASPEYHMPIFLRLRGHLRSRGLRQALRETARRHESLRTTFSEVDGRPVQMVDPDPWLPLEIVDVAGLPRAEGTAIAERLARSHALCRFDLDTGPLARALWIRTGRETSFVTLTLHHVVSDGWSLGVLFDELSRLLRAFGSGTPSPLDDLEIQYPDFAVWQRQTLDAEHLEARLAAWREELAGAPPELEIPTDRPRPPRPDAAGRSVPVEWTPELSDRIRDAARRLGVTRFQLLLAAFGVLLSEWSDQDDLVVGSPVANRSREELEPLVGFFVNMLPLRVDVSGSPTFRTLVDRVRAVTLRAYDRQDLPFEKLVAELAPERDRARQPLFQVVFQLESPPSPSVELPDLTLEPWVADRTVSPFDLTLRLFDGETRIAGLVEFRTALFDPTTVQRLSRRFQDLVTTLVDRPEAPVRSHPTLAPAERHQLLVEWGGETGEDSTDDVFGRFRAQVRRRPDAVAVVGDDVHVSYGELERRAWRVASALRCSGIGPESRVALLADRAPDRIAAMLGTLAAGAVYVPLEHEYPPDRLGLLLADARAAACLVDPHLADRLPPPDELRRIPLVPTPERPETTPDPVPETSRLDGRSLAYVMYTSGSTGRPKGVAVTHDAILRLVETPGFIRFGPDRVYLHMAPASFDASTFEIWGALLHGARLVLAPPGKQALEDLGDLLGRHGITTMWWTAGLFHQMTELAPEGLADLSELLAGGDALSPVHVSRARSLLRNGKVVNGYGPTENTTFTTCYDIQGDPVELRTVPIGRPIPGTYVYVLNRDLEPVPVGVVGELYTGGRGLARGYLEQPARTAESFLPDPLGGRYGAGSAGDRVYRTGDRVRWLARGVLEFFGRSDDQAKIRGFRVEPAEVETVLDSLPTVGCSVVVVRGRGAEDKHLVAYVVLADETSVDRLAEAVARRLPDYMVPARFVLLDALPLTPNGKVDRRALPEPDDPTGAGRSPRTVLERSLAGIWREVLGVEEVGVDRDFFELGGHSLSATRVVSRIRSRLGRDVPLSALFEHPTVEALARDLERRVRAELPPLCAASGDRPLPLSFAQERLWFLSRLEGASAAYHMPFVVRLSGGLRRGALAASLHELRRRHEALRTTFPETRGEPRQEISSDVGLFPLHWVEAAGETDGRSVCIEFLRRPFRLEHGPLVRALCVRIGPRRHVLALVFHHVVSDGWSADVVFTELAELYRVAVEGRPSPLDEPTLQYADFAAWQRRWLSGDALDLELAWWRRRLEGAPAESTLPADRPRPRTASYVGRGLQRRLRPAVVDRLNERLRRFRATRFQVLLTVYAATLARSAGQADWVVGTPVANRNLPETEGIVGLFVNTLALRLDLSGDPTFEECLERVVDATLGAYDHQAFPFEKLVAEIAPERDLTRQPVFQTMFQVEAPKTPDENLLPGLRLEPWDGEHATSAFDLGVMVLDLEATGEMVVTVEYSTALYDPTTVDRFVRRYEHVLDEVLAAPDRHLSHLSAGSAAQRQQLLWEWNDAPSPRSPRVWPHLRIERWAMDTPDRIAVVDGCRHLSYAELVERARRVSHGLRDRGLGPEDRVGLLVRRSPEAVGLILGILRTGAAYVPLSVDGPAARTTFQAVDAGLALCVLDDAGAAAKDDVEVPRAQAAGLWNGPRDSMAAREPEPAAAAYVIYTSGTTGRPKGVVVPHRGPAAMFRAWEEIYGLGGDVRRWLQVASLTFDVFTGDWIRCLASGGTLVLCPRDASLDPESLTSWLELESIEAVELVPAVLREVLDRLVEADGEAWPALRLLILGSDVWYVHEMDRTLGLLSHRTRLVNTYGTTEGTVDSTWIECAVGGRPREVPVPAGRPFAGDRVWVLDRALHPAPHGCPGEVATGGRGLARGYVGRPAETAARFIPHPFSERPGDRIYRTGDLGRVSARGVLELLGRVDFQVQVRGLRVEPGEIEVALAEHPEVGRAAVVMHHERLVAYVTRTGEPTAEEGEVELEAALRRHLLGLLPASMIPSAFVLLDTMPLTAHGKVDRAALPEPVQGAPREGRVPRPGAERHVAEAFRDVLGLTTVGRDDGFFALGGHSLSAIRVLNRLEDVSGVRLSLRILFENPTVEDLARHVDAGRGDPHPVEPVLERVSRRDGPFPLSLTQERFWFIQVLEPALAAYNLSVAVHVRGGLGVGAWCDAMRGLVARHEILRVSYPAVDGEPRQLVRPPPGHRASIVDLRSLRAPDRLPEARRLAGLQANLPFDLARETAFRHRVVRVSDGDWLLLTDLHHIAGDAWSLGVLGRDAASLYGASLRGVPADLPQLPIQYVDFAVWQRRRESTSDPSEAIDWWRDYLRGAPELLELPTDRPRPPIQDFSGGACRVPFSKTSGRRLATAARDLGVTPFVLLAASYFVFLSRLAGRDDLTIGAPSAGRRRSETEGLIGCFVRTLVVRGSLSGLRDFRGIVRHVRDRVLAARSHEEVPFEKLVEALNPRRSRSYTPLFQAMLNLENVPVEPLELPGLEIVPLSRGRQAAHFDLTWTVESEGSAVGSRLEFARALFDDTTAQRMARHLAIFAEAAWANADLPLENLPWLSAPERHQVTGEWSGADAPRAGAETLHEAFFETARRRPDSVALLAGDESVSYGALAKRARRLGRRLRSAGIGRGRVVALSMPRSVDFVVAMLGVLRAGAAYLPIDPDDPAERREWIRRDAGVDRVLTTAWDGGEVEAAGPNAIPARIDPLDAAYLLYTSGSTGRPKGVVTSHAAATWFTYEAARRFGWEDADRMLQFAPLSFDVLLEETFPVWATGGTVVLEPASELKTLSGLEEAMVRHEVTAVELPVLFWQEWVDDLARSDRRPPASLRHVLLGCDAPSRPLLEAWNGWGIGTTYVFGLTETAVTSASRRVDPTREVPADLPIGRPWPGSRLRVLDGLGRAVPVGVVGELAIGGRGLARGYRGRAAETARRFVPDPHAEEPGARLYRTGDRARWTSRGELLFLGRLDHQVKIRGFRIEPGEVESCLQEHPEILEAVVIPIGEAGDKHLAAFVSPPSETDVKSVDSSRIRRHAVDRLPEYMVPSRIEVLAEIPRTATGKVDRKALVQRKPSVERAVEDLPRDALERRVAEVFEEVLGRPVGRRESFFDAGGHSLAVVRLLAKLERLTTESLPLSVLFEADTVAALARRIRWGIDGSDTSRVHLARASEASEDSEASEAPPWFFAPPMGGTVWCYRSLASALGRARDVDVWGLIAPGLGSDTAPESMEELARELVKEVREIRPHGPYRLAGWSFGGVVAFEMACRLQADGEEIERLVLIDPDVPAGDGRLPSEEAMLAEFAADLGLDVGARDGLVPPDLELDAWARRYEDFRRHYRIWAHYRPSEWVGDLTWIRGAETVSTARTGPTWAAWVRGDVRVVDVDAGHAELLEDPAVRIVGKNFV